MSVVVRLDKGLAKGLMTGEAVAYLVFWRELHWADKAGPAVFIPPHPPPLST